MNLNDFDAGQGPTTPEERRTAQLCAYLFDELDAPERAELETALASDAEMSAELESLRATIGLVRREHAASASSEPRLSAGAMATLTAKAAGPKLSMVAPSLQKTTVIQGVFNNAGRLAAASLIIMGGLLGFLQFDTLNSDTHQARFEYDMGGEHLGPNTEREYQAGREVSRTQAPASEESPQALNGLRYLGLDSSSSTVNKPSSSVESQVRTLWTKRMDPEAVRDSLKVTREAFVGAAQAPSGGGGGGSGGPSTPGPGGPATVAPATTLGVNIASSSSERPMFRAFTAGGLDVNPTKAERPDLSRLVAQRNRGSSGNTGPSAQELERRLKLELGRRLKANGYSDADIKKAKAKVELRGLGAPVSEARGLTALGSKLTLAKDKKAPAKDAQLAQLEALGYAAIDSEAETGADEFFLGRGEKEDRSLGGFYDEGADAGGYRGRMESLYELQSLSLEERARKLADQWIAHCQPVKNERPRDMYFRFWGDNPYVFSSQDNLATFAADVDTASYALARRYLVDGVLPTKAQIRTEEFVNAFRPDVPAPAEETFAITTELAPSPFGGSDSRWMLRVTVRGKEVSREQRQPLAITFVVDTSGSMKQGQRLELVKHALRLLVSQLDARDSIALVAFSNEARLILPMTSAAQRGVIEAAIFPLKPDGGTNAEAGLKLGYELAATGLAVGVHNRVVFLSDGVANMGQTNQDQLSADVKHRRDQGIYLNTIGVGMGNHNDVFLERLADQGDGICDYVDDAAAVERAIVERFTGAFIPIASDVKIQVEFDPTRVLRYRQIGYENRAVADADFRNDAVDAGEIGAGHQVTALFEIERVGSDVTADAGPLATVRLRWKEPKGAGKDPREARVTEVEHTLASKQALGIFESASAGFQRAVLVAQFSEVLRQSNHAQSDSYDLLVSEIQRVRSLPAWANDADTKELLALVIRAGNLGAGKAPQWDDLTQVIDEYRRHQYLRSQLDGMQQKVGGVELKQLQDANDRLELRIRDLCLQQLR